MPLMTNPFDGDAFSDIELTAAINSIDHVPGRVGELCFAGNAQGVPTTSVAVEMREMGLTLIPTSARGGPAPKETADKRKLISFDIPHIKIEDTLYADSVQNVREFGTNNLLSPEQAVNDRLTKMAGRLDMTLENLRLGAIKGEILDADGVTVLFDLFREFGIAGSEPGPELFTFQLDGSETADVRATCQQITRFMWRQAKSVIPSGAQVWALCGDAFFDSFISTNSVKQAFDNIPEAVQRLGGNYAWGTQTFAFGGIVWENYRGSDDGTSVTIDPDEARLFLTGVPGLYAEYYGPGDFMETANMIGLPRYAKMAPDPRFNRFVELHVQSNPLPLCLRPQTLTRAVIG